MEWEFTILDMLQNIQNPVLTKIMAFITMLGEAGWFWIVLGIVLLCTKKYRKCGVAVLFALILDLILANIILKPLVARPRPCWIREEIELLVRVPKDYSFPVSYTQLRYEDSYIAESDEENLWDNQYIYDDIIDAANRNGTEIITDLDLAENEKYCSCLLYTSWDYEKLQLEWIGTMCYVI